MIRGPQKLGAPASGPAQEIPQDLGLEQDYPVLNRMLLARACFDQGKYYQAQEIYSEFIADHPRHRELRILRAEAIQTYLESKKVSPDQNGAETKDPELLQKLLGDRAMSTALDAEKQKADLKKLVNELAPHQIGDPQKQKEVIARLEASAQAYLQLAAVSLGNPGDTQFANKKMCELAAETYRALAQYADGSQDPSLKRRAVLYDAYYKLTLGRIDEAEISLDQIEGEIPEAKERLELLRQQKLRQLNLAALQSWKNFTEEKSAVLSRAQRSPLGSLLWVANRIFRSDGRNQDDDLAISHAQDKKLIEAVQEKILSAEVNTLQEALWRLSEDGEEAIRNRARELAQGSVSGAISITGSSDLIPRLIEYTSTLEKDEALALNLLDKAQGLQKENLEAGTLHTSLGIYAILKETSEDREVQRRTIFELNQSTIPKGIPDYVMAYLQTTALENLALEFTLMAGGTLVGGMARAATLEKFRIGTEVTLKGRALGYAAFAGAGGTSLWALNTAKEALAGDPKEVLKAEYLARSWGAAVVMFGGLSIVGDLGYWVGPKLAGRIPGLVRAGSGELNWGGQLVSNGITHGLGMGAMTGISQLNQTLKLTDTPKGGWQETLAHNLVTYFQFSLARAFVAPYLPEASQSKPSAAQIEAKRRELIRMAQDKLQQWKQDPDTPMEFDRFFLEVQSTLGKEPLSEAYRQKAIARWERDFTEIQEKIGLNGLFLSPKKYVQKLENLLWWKYFHSYEAGTPRMLDFINKGKGNCVGRCETEVAAIEKARVQFLEDEIPLIEIYSDHIEPLIYYKSTEEVWRPQRGTKDQHIPVSLYHPALFYDAFLQRQGAPSPVGPRDLIFLERNPPYRPAAGSMGGKYGDRFYDFPFSGYAYDQAWSGVHDFFSPPPSWARVLNRILPRRTLFSSPGAGIGGDCKPISPWATRALLLSLALAASTLLQSSDDEPVPSSQQNPGDQITKPGGVVTNAWWEEKTDRPDPLPKTMTLEEAEARQLSLGPIQEMLLKKYGFAYERVEERLFQEIKDGEEPLDIRQGLEEHPSVTRIITFDPKRVDFMGVTPHLIFRNPQDKKSFDLLKTTEEQFEFIKKRFEIANASSEYQRALQMFRSPAASMAKASPEEIKRANRFIKDLETEVQALAPLWNDLQADLEAGKKIEPAPGIQQRRKNAVNLGLEIWKPEGKNLKDFWKAAIAEFRERVPSAHLILSAKEAWQKWTQEAPDQYMLLLNTLTPNKIASVYEVTRDNKALLDLFAEGVEITGTKTRETPLEAWMEPPAPEHLVYVPEHLVYVDFDGEPDVIPELETAEQKESQGKEKTQEKTEDKLRTKRSEIKISGKTAEQKESQENKKTQKKTEDKLRTKRSEIKISPETALALFLLGTDVWYRNLFRDVTFEQRVELPRKIPQTLNFSTWNQEISARFQKMNRDHPWTANYLGLLDSAIQWRYLPNSHRLYGANPFVDPEIWLQRKSHTPSHMWPILKDMERYTNSHGPSPESLNLLSEKQHLEFLKQFNHFHLTPMELLKGTESREELEEARRKNRKVEFKLEKDQ